MARYIPAIAYWIWRQQSLGYPGAGPGNGGLPDPGAGMAYLVDNSGNYLVDSNGAYLIGAA